MRALSTRRTLSRQVALVPRLCLGTHCPLGFCLPNGQDARQSLASSPFPGRAWEREYSRLAGPFPVKFRPVAVDFTDTAVLPAPGRGGSHDHGRHALRPAPPPFPG